MTENKIKTQKFIVKYFTEIMIKGDRAKRQMLSQLLMNLQKISKDISNEIVLKKFFDKIELSYSIRILFSFKRETITNTRN